MTLADGHQSIVRSDVCAVGAVRRVAAMLDLEPSRFVGGDMLPRGWHFFLLGGEAPRSDLRADGFSGFGVPIPDLGLPRLLIAGRTVAYHSDIPIGANIVRSSVIDKIEHKTVPSGPMALVTLRHELKVNDAASPAVVEKQTFVLLSSAGGAAKRETSADNPNARHTKIVTPDDTMLFQYSALGFNSHKIHLDRSYARDVEGLPDLVVNGGLTTLLLTEFLRRDIGLVPKSLKARYLAPLYSGRPVALAAHFDGARWILSARDDAGIIAASVEVEAQ